MAQSNPGPEEVMDTSDHPVGRLKQVILADYVLLLDREQSIQLRSPHTVWLSVDDYMKLKFVLFSEVKKTTLSRLLQDKSLILSVDGNGVCTVKFQAVTVREDEAVEAVIKAMVEDVVWNNVLECGKDLLVTPLYVPDLVHGLQELNGSNLAKRKMLLAEKVRQGHHEALYVVCTTSHRGDVGRLMQEVHAKLGTLKRTIELSERWGSVARRVDMEGEVRQRYSGISWSQKWVEDGLVVMIEGTKEEVMKAEEFVHNCIQDFQANAKVSGYEIAVDRVLTNKDFIQNVDDILLSNGVKCAWYADRDKKEITFYAMRPETVHKSIEIFKSCVVEKEIPLAAELKEQVDSPDWPDARQQLMDKWPMQVLVTMDSKKIFVTGISKAVEGVYASLCPARKDTVIVKISDADVFSYLMQIEEGKLVEKADSLGVDIKMNEDSCRITVHGRREAVEKMENFIQKMVKRITSSSVRLNNTIGEYYKTEEGRGFLEEVESNCHVTVEMQQTASKNLKAGVKSSSASSAAASASRDDARPGSGSAVSGREGSGAGKPGTGPDTQGSKDRWRFWSGEELEVVQTVAEESGADVVVQLAEGGRNKGKLEWKKKNDFICTKLHLPDWSREKNKKTAMDAVSNRVWQIVQQAKEDKMKSLAFPLHECNGWSPKQYLKVLITALGNTFESDGGWRCDFTVFVCSSQADRVAMATDYCTDMLPTANRAPEAGVNSDIPQNKIKISVVNGLLNQTKVDVLVNTTSPDLNLNNGAVSASLLKAAGHDLQRECNKYYRDGVADGEVAVTKGYKLQCRFVFHGALFECSRDCTDAGHFYRQSIADFVRVCLENAERQHMRSIAFPAVGCGKLGYPVNIVAEEMFAAVRRHSQPRETTLKEVKFVIYPGDEDAVKAFGKEEQDHEELIRRASVPTSEICLKLVGKEENVEKAIGLINDPPMGLKKQIQPESQRKMSASPSKSPTTTRRSQAMSEQPSHGQSSTQSVRITVEIPNKLFQQVFSFYHGKVIESFKGPEVQISYTEKGIHIVGTPDQVGEAKSAIDKCLKHVKELQCVNFPLPVDEVKIDTVKECIRACNLEIGSDDQTFCLLDDQVKGNLEVYIYGDQFEALGQKRMRLQHDLGLIKSTCRPGRNLTVAGGLSSTSDGKYDYKEAVSTQQPPSANRSFSWTNDAKQVQIFHTKEGLVVRVYEADVLNLPVDCIVNAANAEMQHGGGVAEVIAKAAGRGLVEDSNVYIRKHGKVGVGKVCTTSAGNLRYSWVIHAVGPRWRDYLPRSREAVTRCERDLYNAVYNSLVEADSINVKSVALPAISAGIYGVPTEICVVQYAKAVLDYSQRKPPRHLQEVHFIDKKADLVAMMHRAFGAMIPDGKPPQFYNKNIYIQSSVSTEGNRKGPRSPDVPSLMNGRQETAKPPMYTENREGLHVVMPEGHTLIITTGDLLRLKGKVDAVACAEDLKGTGKGIISGKLQELDQKEYWPEKNREFAKKRKHGEIVVCKGGKTGFHWVLHALLKPKTKMESEKERREKFLNMYYDLFVMTVNFQEKAASLALPLIGSGTGNADPVFCAELLFESFQKFCCRHRDRILTVHLVSFEREKTDVIKDAVKTGLWSTGYQRDQASHKASMSRSVHENKPQKKTLARSTSWSKGDRKKGVSNGKVVQSSDPDEAESMPDIQSTGGAASMSGKTKDVDNGESCSICMDGITSPKKLRCSHVFCADCIDQYFRNYKKVCPICGAVCGVVRGDQPEGTMTVNYSALSVAGFEGCGRIEITYSFLGGNQRRQHPNPGKPYKGIHRVAYLPNNREGKKVCELLRVAFDRKLVFTIGHSRTTGEEGVITWNDIHHKTNPNPGQQFGYPDPTYLDRVLEELSVKGVTEDDLPTLSARGGARRNTTQTTV